MPRGEGRVTHDPVPLHGHLDLVLALGRLQQVCPQRVGPDQRRLERILVVLGILGEQVRPGIAVEGLPGALVSIQEVAGGSVVHGQSSDPRSSQQALGDAVAVSAAHHEDGVAGPDLVREPFRGRVDRARGLDPDPRPAPSDGLREAGGGGDRGVRVSTGPDVRDDDRIG